MSGPKSSGYQFSQWRREELARQAEEQRRRQEEHRRREEERRREGERRREEERRRELERQRQEVLNHIGSMKDSLKNRIPELEMMRSRAFYMSGYQDVSITLDEMDALLEQLKDGTKPWTSLNLPAVKAKKKEIEHLASDMEKKMVLFRAEYETWEKDLSDKLDEQMEDIFRSITVEKEPTPVPEAPKDRSEKQEALRIQAEELYICLQEYQNIVPVQSSSGKEVERVTKAFENLFEKGDFSGAAAYFSMHKRALEQLVEMQKKEEAQRIAAFTEQRIHYESVCDLAGMVPREFDAETEYTSENIQWMKEESVRIEAKYLEEQEQRIISETIEEVMEEMGYTVLGNREIVRRNRKIKERVFSFGEGTGINVTEINGQITMEVVGLDTSDREPDEDEKDYMEEEMESFCDTYKKAEELLKERGIVVKERFQMLPPSREYAQILNTNDYEMKQENVSMIQSRSRKARTGKALEARKMNMD